MLDTNSPKQFQLTYKFDFMENLETKIVRNPAIAYENLTPLK